jgi:hypothetical protein
MKSGNVRQGSGGETKRELPGEIELERMIVAMETVAVATVEPFMEEDAGATSQVDSMGAPVHVQVIV